MYNWHDGIHLFGLHRVTEGEWLELIVRFSEDSVGARVSALHCHPLEMAMAMEKAMAMAMEMAMEMEMAKAMAMMMTMGFILDPHCSFTRLLPRDPHAATTPFFSADRC